MRRTCKFPLLASRCPGELTQPSVVLASYGEKAGTGSSGWYRCSAGRTAGEYRGFDGGGRGSSCVIEIHREPISVNLKDVDLRDFFRLIHEISGLNVVLDPAVKGSLTIVLDEVPWDQALDIVLQNNGLDKQLSGNVLRIATHDTLRKEAESVRDLEKAQSEAIPPVTFTRSSATARQAL